MHLRAETAKNNFHGLGQQDLPKKRTKTAGQNMRQRKKTKGFEINKEGKISMD